MVSLLLGEARLVTVAGAGGAGKTRLALAVADRLLDELADGAFLGELAELTSAEEAVGAIASVVGTTPDRLAGTLAGRELLLVLNNFEHVLDAAPLLGELLAAAPRLRILVTSQGPLRLAEEHTYALAGLAEEPAAALLITRARRASREFAIDGSGATAVAELCRELDGAPLGIELAAARLAVLPPEELLERLRRSPDALGTGGRNLPERQRGLRAAMQWSYDLLDPQAASLFRRIGHFAGEATLERIEQVCDEGIDDVLESLAQLVDLSLVRRTRDGRFEVPSALRTYSRELLEASHDREALCRRHAEAVVAEWLPLAIERPMIAYRQTYGPIVDERSDLAVLLDWSSIGRWSGHRGRPHLRWVAVRHVHRAGRPAQTRCGGRRAQRPSPPSCGPRRTPTSATSRRPWTPTCCCCRTASTRPPTRSRRRPAAAARRGRPRRPCTWWATAICSRGRPQAALPAYARGVAVARDASARDNMAFQGEGIVAALADLGRPEEALETLGACDTLTGDSVHPREHNAFWGSVMGGRIGSARAALGAHAADAAYARGRALAVQEVLELLLSYGTPVLAAS